MRITFLFICLSFLATLCICQQYIVLQVPGTDSYTNMNPCTQAFYTFTIAQDDLVATNYLEIDIQSTSVFYYYLSPNNITFSDLDFTVPTTANTTINVVCDYTTVSQWYLVISNEGDIQLNYTMTIAVNAVGVTPLEIGNTTSVTTNSYDFDDYAQSADFYGVTFSSAPKQFSSLEVTIVSNDANNTVSSAQINFGNLPDTGCQTSVQGSEKTTLFVDYCTLQANQAGTYFISVEPENEDALSYSIEVSNPAPVVTPLSAGTTGLTGYLLSVSETNFYSVSASEGNVLNFTLTDIINGELTVNVNYNTLPFFDCVNGGTVLSQETSTSCQLIVDYCDSIGGAYYIGVQVKSIDNPSLPISYRIFYNQFQVPNPETLEDNEYTTGAVTQSFYSHYEFDSSDFDVSDDSLLNVRLYVDTYNLGTTSYQISLYVNFDEPAGPQDSCWSSIAECTINTGDESSCTIQIDSCLFNEHDNWYASVFAADSIIQTRVIQYTIIATLANPLELTQEYEIISSSVYDGNYDHYYLPEDLFDVGYQVNILITSVSDEIALYVSDDGTPAGEVECPACYNNTGSLSTSQDVSYPVISCPGSEIENDFYFSIQGQSSGSYSSYSVMYVLSTGLVRPLTDLAPDTLAVGSIAPGSSVNYTLGIASFSDENQIVIQLSSQNTTGDLSATLYNSSYLNCLEGNFMYSCTVRSTGYCTFTVPPCVFTTSEGLILSLTNSDRVNPVVYNVEFSNAAVPVNTLTNNDMIVSEIGQFQYDLYEYEVQGGAFSLVVEVVFFDDGEYDPVGYLNVSTLSLGTGPCYPDGDVFTCQSNTKCVYVASSCNLQSETLNIAVYTAYDLYPGLPMKYSIVVREFSSIVPLPTAVNSQSTFTGQIYPGQQVYHTFPVTPNAADGSQVTYQLSGEVTGVVSQNTAPTTSSCPCFEYYPGATLNPNGNTPVSYTIEYCNQVANVNSNTILIETNSNENPAQQVTYTIIASTFSSKPVPLALEQSTAGQVIFGYYQYFTIPSSSDAVSVSITNIVGGSIGIYYSSTGPATKDCSDGAIACATSDSACVSQLPSCDDITYLSVYGATANSASPITFTIVLSGQNRTELTDGVATANTTLSASFTNIYSFSVDDTDVAPVVTFTLTNIYPANANYRISVYTNDLCSSDFVTTTQTASVSIPYCQIQDDDLFFYVSSQETSRIIYYTAEVTVVDAYANNAELDVATPVTAELLANNWVTYVYNQPALDNTEQSSLTFSVTPTTTVYFSYDSYPTIQCSDDVFTRTYTVSSCCVQEGTYYFSFTTNNDANYTVEVVSTRISFVKDITVGTPTTVEIPATQTAEFTFEVTSLEYESFTIFVQSNETVDVSFERISQAGSGLGSCYTNIDSFTCNGNVCAYSIDKCQPYFIGTLFISVTATVGTNVTVEVVSTNSEDLATDGAPVPLTATAEVTYVYLVSIGTDQFLPNQELSIDITSNGVDFVANLFGSSDYCSTDDTLDFCTDDTSCTLTYLLCSAVPYYTLAITAAADADITITASIASVDPTPLTEGVVVAKPDNSEINLYSFTLNETSATQYVTVSIVYEDLTNNFAASWRYYASAPSGIYCLPTDDSENACESYTQDTTLVTTTCTFTIEPCELYAGDFILQIISDQDTDQYTVTYNVSGATPTAITVGNTYYGSILENVNQYYQLPFDRTKILPGQSFEITLDVSCGNADLYINQGILAGPVCSVSDSLTYSLSACDLLESSATSSPDSDFFITVTGGATDYPQFDVRTSYSLSSSISGNEIKFVPIGPNQAVVYDGTPTIYTYNVAGINDFTGELAFTLYVNPEVENADATVYISADVPYHPLLPCGTGYTTLATSQPVATFYENSCTVDSVRMFYISFDASSITNSSIMVSRTKQYVRDLNEYDYYPQSGAVVGAPINFDITDEEYYEIEVDPTTAGFRFQATLSTPQLGWANLLTSLDSQPSDCNTISPSFTCSSQNAADDECEVVIDYCQFDNSVLPHVYLTVNTEFNSATPVPYNLTVVQTVNQIPLSSGASVCGASNSTWTWYSLPVQATTNTFYEFDVYAVSLNQFVDVYLNTEGLATDRCNEMAQTGCTGSCSIVYSCDSFSGQFSIGIEKNIIDTSYFIRASPITINSIPLTLQDSHDSGDDTPTLVGGTEYYFYSFTTPTLTAGQTLVLTVETEGNNNMVSVSYNTGSPSINCVDDEGFGQTVVFFVNSCDYVAGATVFVTVSSDSSEDFTIEVFTLTTTVGTIAIGSNVEDSLFVDTTDSVIYPSFTSYSFSLTATDISTYESFTVNTYGINQGTLSIWITEGKIADLDCAVAQFTNVDTIVLNSCDLTAGTYYVNVLLVAPGQTNPCTPVTFGILLTANAPAIPYNTVTLTSGTASTSSVFFTNNVYQFTPSNPTTSLVTVTTTSTVPLVVTSSCGAISSPVQYFFGCSAQTNLAFTVNPTLSTLTPPSTQYSITAATSTIPTLSSTATTATFAQDYQTLFFYTFTVTEEESLEVLVDVTTGPSVEVQLWSSECDNGANTLIESFVCYSGACVLPVSQRQGAVANATDSNTYYVTVSGYSPSAFSISVSQGESQTCSVPNEDDLEFCTIVSWSTWSYESDSNIIQDQDETAQRRFDYLYLKFCPPCLCQELSEECNTSLTEYVCTQTFRACDYEGFETSVCLTSCQDVEQNCGKTFEDIGLPELSCNHNFYLSEDDPICTDIYETTSSNSELILWIVVGVVLFIVVVVLISVAVVFFYKQAQARRRASSYEVLE